MSASTANRKSLLLLYFSRFSNAASGFIFLPILSRKLDENIWVSYSAIQGIAVVLALFSELWWRQYGMIHMLRENQKQIGLVLAQSYFERLLTLIFILPLMAVICLVWDRKSWLLLFLSTLYILAGSLSKDWFLTSQGKYIDLLRQDTIPRLCGTLIASILLYFNMFNDAFAFLGIWYFLFFSFTSLRKSDYLGAMKLISFNFEKVRFTLINTLSTIYYALPLPIMAIFKFHGIFAYSLSDRLYKMLMSAILPLSLILQPKIISLTKLSNHEQLNNMRSSILRNAFLYVFFSLVALNPIIVHLVLGKPTKINLVYFEFVVLAGLVGLNRSFGFFASSVLGTSKILLKSQLIALVIGVLIFAMTLSFKRVEFGMMAIILSEIAALLTFYKSIFSLSEKRS